MLGHLCLNKLKKIEIISSYFYDYNIMNLQIISSKIRNKRGISNFILHGIGSPSHSNQKTKGKQGRGWVEQGKGAMRISVLVSTMKIKLIIIILKVNYDLKLKYINFKRKNIDAQIIKIKIKVSLSVDDLIVYIENPKDSTKKY